MLDDGQIVCAGVRQGHHEDPKAIRFVAQAMKDVRSEKEDQTESYVGLPVRAFPVDFRLVIVALAVAGQLLGAVEDDANQVALMEVLASSLSRF